MFNTMDMNYYFYILGKINCEKPYIFQKAFKCVPKQRNKEVSKIDVVVGKEAVHHKRDNRTYPI